MIKYNMLNQASVPTIKKAVVKLKQMSDDDRMKERARMREKAIHDEVSALNTADGKDSQLKKLVNVNNQKDRKRTRKSFSFCLK